MPEARRRYVQAREVLLTYITETLERDERIVAAWLAGSYGRGEQKWSSDLDLHVVVAHDYSELLCAQPWSVGARTTPERLALFKQFGEPAIIYDAHANNLIGGTFTYVLYQESAINVDWMLIPQFDEKSPLMICDLPANEPLELPKVCGCYSLWWTYERTAQLDNIGLSVSIIRHENIPLPLLDSLTYVFASGFSRFYSNVPQDPGQATSSSFRAI